MDKKNLRRASALVDEISGAAAPLERLTAAKQLRELAEDLERTAGIEARKAGVSLAAIGEVYGATRQAMAQRFAPR